ncbi:MAG: hypothetical protein K1X74_17400 [Pirellulales bacterium]|nr:hypothetical protein [Pirellulales bacterium]
MDDLLSFNCAHCRTKLQIDRKHIGRRGKCPKCGEEMQIEPAIELLADEAPPAIHWKTDPRIPVSIRQSLCDEHADCLRITQFTDQQLRALDHWAYRLYNLGKHETGTIEEIKFSAHLVVLDDGSEWEVDDDAAWIVDGWSVRDQVVIIDGEMCNITHCDRAAVSKVD